MTDRVWIADQVTVLAEGFGAPLTPQRLQLYVDHLCDLQQATLAQAIGRAVRELKFFPAVAELRQFAGAGAGQDADLAAEAAWQRALENIRKFGISRLPTYTRGKLISPPTLDSRTEYAIRAAGGRAAINDSLNAESVSAEAFCKKRFFEAYLHYDEAKVAALAELPAAVKGMVQQLLPPSAAMLTKGEQPNTPPRPPIKPVPTPLTEADIEVRRTLLAQQAAELKRRFAQ